MDQKCRNSLNVAAAEPQNTDSGQDTKKFAAESAKKPGQRQTPPGSRGQSSCGQPRGPPRNAGL